MKDRQKQSKVLSLASVILVLTLEVSFTRSVLVNVFLIGVAILYLLYLKKYQALCFLAIVPLLPAIGTYWSVMLRGTGQADAILLVSRTFVFAALGMVFAFGIDFEELLLVLEQKKLPPQFVYGILVVVHALPEIKNEVAALIEASVLRGKKLHFWSPMIYLKVIFTSISWRDRYTEAMYSRGFTEGAQRSCESSYVESIWGICGALGIFLCANLLLIL